MKDSLKSTKKLATKVILEKRNIEQTITKKRKLPMQKYSPSKKSLTLNLPFVVFANKQAS